MIVLEDVTKTIWLHGKKKKVLSAVNIQIPSDRRIALLGARGGHQRVLIHLLGGVERPTAGRITRLAEVSYPVGFLPGLSKDLSARANVAHIARLYSVDVGRTLDLVEMILDVGSRFDRPFAQLDANSRRHLGEIVALCLPFHTYLMPNDRLVRRLQIERTDKQKPDLAARLDALFKARFRSSGMIIPTTDVKFARRYCDMILVMEDEQLVFADDAHLALKSEKPRREKKRTARIG